VLTQSTDKPYSIII